MSDEKIGLTSQEVEQRIKDGLVNGNCNVPTKSIKQILITNTITFFNFLNIFLAGMVIAVGSYKDALFICIILCNITIGIFQEIRAKRTIDKLTLISAPKACALRDGKEVTIASSEIVLDEVMVLRAGMQICADCEVVSGECEVNESLLTGESDLIPKKAGDTAMSGSFVVCGEMKARAIHLGEENYANKITSGAKYLKKSNSKMLHAINTLIKGVTFFIIPTMILLLVKSIFFVNQSVEDAVTSTVAAIIGMIPEGLVLLISVVLAVSVIRLSMCKTLVQDMYCIETLARVDVLCLDKTGTITEGTMQVDEVISLDGSDCGEAMTALMNALDDRNPTFNAAKEKWNGESGWKCVRSVPFSSQKKWSGAEFEGKGTYIMGAGEFILGGAFEAIREQCEKASANGQRVLLLAHSDKPFREKELPENITPSALILISDKIRKEAPDTLRYFREQGVEIKIISGDNPITVSSVAKSAGVANYDNYIDASTVEDIASVADKYTIFGRVTPDQKLALVKALKAAGRTVGMTGDGVNDVLALKEADVSIAMQSGSDAARNVSSLVLLDSNFASLPKVVYEGRRSTNNVERSASLFLTKTVYSFLLAVIFLFLPAAYPITPIHMTLVNAITIGAPSFLLALQQNKNIIKGTFIGNVLKLAVPQGIAAVLALMSVVVYQSVTGMEACSHEQMRTMAMLVLGFVSFAVVWRICLPFDLKKDFGEMSAAVKEKRLYIPTGILKALMMLGMLGAFAIGVLPLGGIFDVYPLTLPQIIMVAVTSVLAIALAVFFPRIITPLVEKGETKFHEMRRNKKEKQKNG